MGAAKVIRTTGESDPRLAERGKFQIIADNKREIEMLVDNDPASPAWIERQAIGIRKAVSRREIDDQIANDIIGNLRDQHLKANSRSPDDDLPPVQVSRLSALTRLATDLTYHPSANS